MKLDPVFDEVHAANMNKVGEGGKVLRSATGKVLKPEGWVPPDVESVLERQMA